MTSKNAVLALLVFCISGAVQAFAEIGGTVESFRTSAFAKTLGLALKSHEKEGDVFMGTGDVMVALFKGPAGTITRQRLKWFGNTYPDGETTTLIFITFCME